MIGKYIIRAIVVLSLLVWGYAFSPFADRVAPDTLGAGVLPFRELVEPICTSTMTSLDALPNALDASDSVERSGQIKNANDLLLDMVDRLEAQLDAPSVTLNQRDRGITAEWITDWRNYIADRDDFASRMSDDPNAQLFIGAVGGERLERRITRFANTNRIYSCVTPSDVG